MSTLAAFPTKERENQQPLSFVRITTLSQITDKVSNHDAGQTCDWVFALSFIPFWGREVMVTKTANGAEKKGQ